MEMDTALVEKLNQSLNLEFHSAYKYFAMATYFAEINLKGFSKYMIEQAKEEMDHARKIYDYLLLRNQKVNLWAIEATDINWINATNIFEDALNHEKYVTECYTRFFEQSKELKDHACTIFLKWFIEEQVEEEATFLEMLERVKLAQSCACGIAQLDRHLMTC